MLRTLPNYYYQLGFAKTTCPTFERRTQSQRSALGILFNSGQRRLNVARPPPQFTSLGLDGCDEIRRVWLSSEGHFLSTLSGYRPNSTVALVAVVLFCLATHGRISASERGQQYI